MGTVRRICGAFALAVTSALVPISAQSPQQPSVFRRATNLVTVDAYPRKDGRIIEGLTPSDFEILEDGVPQKVDQFEFVRVEPVPETARRDPNNTREMLELAADPHNRVFVTYLDVYFTQIQGSHDIRAPLGEMLNRVLGPNDLFGVTTSKLDPKFLVLGRKTQSIEEQLAKYWPWGRRNELIGDPSDPAEALLARCFDTNWITGLRREGFDDGVKRYLTEILIDRRHEEATLLNLRDLIVHMGAMREARSLIVVVTDGWRLFRPDRNLIEDALAEQAQWAVPRPPRMIIDRGKLDVNTGLNETYSQAACDGELARLGSIDDARLHQDIIKLANRSNVVFYPVNASGLEVFDRTVAQTPIRLARELDWHNGRVDSARVLADNTDGIAVVNTNDLRSGLGRIVDDVSAYYLLGYYSTNSKADGKFREITVRVKQPNVKVAARRGYLATSTTEADKAARETRSAGGAAATDVAPALKALPRADASDLFAYGVLSGSDLLVVAEIAGGKMPGGAWSDGGSVKVVVNDASGDPAGTATERIEPGTRGALVRVPVANTSGPWRVGITMIGTAGALDERIDVRAGSGRLVSDPIAWRGGSTARSALRPAADFLFHRTERLRFEFAALGGIDRRTARVLDVRGQPLAIEATLTERDDNGGRWIVADLNLAPLSPGEYVMELSVTGGAETERRYVAFRLAR